MQTKIETYIGDDTACTAVLTHYAPYKAAQTYGEPEDCAPEEPEEIEFSVFVDGTEIDTNTLDVFDYMRIERELIEAAGKA